MKIKVNIPYGVGTISDWNQDELLINGESIQEILKKVGKEVKEKGIERPIVDLSMTIYVVDATESMFDIV